MYVVMIQIASLCNNNKKNVFSFYPWKKFDPHLQHYITFSISNLEFLLNVGDLQLF